jgi:hypothetical protein
MAPVETVAFALIPGLFFLSLLAVLRHCDLLYALPEKDG